MYKILLIVLYSSLLFSNKKVLHLTFHSACAADISYVCRKFDLEVDTWNISCMQNRFLDPGKSNSSNVIMDHDKAERIFEAHKATFEKYDLIITSDIAPLSRIFLQNNWKKPLLIWVCNRFDINVKQSGFNEFPDREYLDLFENAQFLENVEIVGCTEYEKFHAQKNRNITSIKKIIYPTGVENPKGWNSIPINVNKKGVIFFRDYFNERKINLGLVLKLHGVKAYSGEYGGSVDLKDFLGIVHIPCVMENSAMWDNLSNSIVHFLPTKEFYRELYINRKIYFIDWTLPTNCTNDLPIEEIFKYSSWYRDDLAPLFVFFNSFSDLRDLVKNTDYTNKKKAIKKWHRNHVISTLKSWEPVFNRLIGTGVKDFSWVNNEVISST